MTKVFEIGSFPEDANNSLITLIPKLNNPEVITRFLPIVLSNVVVKCITKVIVNSLKPVMET